VATTCHLYPDATEGLILPEGESRHDDCAEARVNEISTANTMENIVVRARGRKKYGNDISMFDRA
jgi:hypothetical protein